MTSFAQKQRGILASLPLDSVVWYGVYTFLGKE
jgi:hypothetical protein